MAWLLLLAVIIIWFILFLRKKLIFKFSVSPKVLEIKPLKGLKKLSDDLERSLKKLHGKCRREGKERE